MWNKIINWIGFTHNEKGTILIFIGMAALPMVLAGGLAIDISNGFVQKHKLQSAANAAAQAAFTNGGGNIATITAQAQAIFNANTHNMTGVSNFTVSNNATTGAVTVSASIVVPTTLMALAGLQSFTYNVSSTAAPVITTPAEIAIVYEVSARMLGSQYHYNICTQLINFVNTLPNNVMVSITPFATDFILDPTTTNPAQLFGNLSPTTNDESAFPGYYPLSSNYAWTLANFNYVGVLYYTNNVFSIYTSHKSPAPTTCPGGYTSCPLLMWPLTCLPSLTNVSCSQVYTYIANVSTPILPLTANKTLIINYLTNLQNYQAQTDGFFSSLLSWGWRTIDPQWNNFWLVNSNATNTARASGQYPAAYGGIQKSMILINGGTAYWGEYNSDVVAYYSNTCGNAADVVGGVNHWWMTSYGMVSVPTDYISLVQDITCENYAYTPMDKVLGLSLTNSTNYQGTTTSTNFVSNILTAINAKFLRICSNIKAKGVNIYLLTPSSSLSTLTPCCNSSANAYAMSNSASGISTPLMAIQAQIIASIKPS